MDRSSRKKIIEEIESIRKSNILVYFCSDRPLASASIAEDVIRPLYDHLLAFREKNKSEKIDLFLYSRGGNVTVPWRLVSTIREFCNEFNVLIPYRAYSAATLIAIGADSIVMGPKGELGPIDPTLNLYPPHQNYPTSVGVEDVASYMSFMKERAGLKNGNSLEKAALLLAEKIFPLTVGKVNREYSQIRLVAQKMFDIHNKPIEKRKIKKLIETLTEKIYSHGHGIARKEARDLGLPVIFPERQLENKMWDLHLAYEEFLDILSPIDPKEKFDGKEENEWNDVVKVAVIESENHIDVFEGKLKLSRIRQTLQNLQLNLNVALPSSIDFKQLPPDQQGLIKNLIGGIKEEIAKLALKEINKSSPVINYGAEIIGGMWKRF